MSVYKVTPNDVESLTLVTTPRRNYSTGSSGITGSIRVYPRASPTEKDAQSPLFFNDSLSGAALDGNFVSSSENITKIVRSKRVANQSIIGEMGNYIDLVSSTSKKKNTVLDIERLTPTTQITRNTLIKNNTKEVLMRYYGTNYPLAHWAYTNYNTVNFFTSEDGYIPSNTVLLYPNASLPDVSHPEGYASGSYSLSGSFSFDFYINPRYKTIKAGTILHLSSSYALSLVTGSRKDENGLPDGFRLQLQLSHTADYPPSSVLHGSNPFDLVFLSDDNSLSHNNWHHAIVRWGTNEINNGTGSFIIDGLEKGIFVIPSGTISPYIEGSGRLNPGMLCIGNFYEGSNLGTSAQHIFFGQRSSRRDGTTALTIEDTQDQPDDFTFNHPLNAEVHDLTVKRYYVTDSEIKVSEGNAIGIGSGTFDRSKIAFYLPPFFVEESPIRRFVGTHGGIPQTPFFEIDGTTDDPFNVAMAFGVNGHYINLENFTKDFSTGRFPRLLNLTASIIDHTTDSLAANVFLYDSGIVAKRNLTILPCDDGNFTPNYEPLKFEKLRNKYTDTNGAEDYSFINLDNLVFDPTVTGLNNNTPDDYVAEQIGATPENPGKKPGPAYQAYADSISSDLASISDDTYFNRGVQKGAPLTIYQRTGDPSSNQITFFNISNLYYGRRIQPGSFMLRDTGISGSAGRIGITLRDDGGGNIYRGDSETPHSTQNSVGNIFYDEGVILIKSPHLYFFGKNGFEISFKGVQNIYTQKYEILATSAHLNSSSNTTYTHESTQLRASSNTSDEEPFVYISGLNLHDENMNILAKARLAQPIIKRESDSIIFKIAFDF